MLETQHIGTSTVAVLRAYATEASKLPKLVDELKATVEWLRDKVNHVRIAVWVNAYYPGADFGGSTERLVEVFAGDSFVSVRSAGGDLFVDVLNASLYDLYSIDGPDGYYGMLVLSATAYHLLTPRVVEAMDQAITDGARAIAVVSPDNPITLQGVISNTCAFWDMAELFRHGGFNGIDTRPPDFDYNVHHQGVGEFANLFALGNKGKEILAVIVPDVEEGDTRTITGDSNQKEKLANKGRRVGVVLAMLGRTMEDLRETIMPGYPCDLRKSYS